MKEWIIKDQLGRRNLTEQEASYYRGKLYESRKRQGARTDLTLAQNVLKLSVLYLFVSLLYRLTVSKVQGEQKTKGYEIQMETH